VKDSVRLCLQWNDLWTMFQSELGDCAGLEGVWIDTRMLEALAYREGVAGLASNISPSSVMSSKIGASIGPIFGRENQSCAKIWAAIPHR